MLVAAFLLGSPRPSRMLHIAEAMLASSLAGLFLEPVLDLLALPFPVAPRV